MRLHSVALPSPPCALPTELICLSLAAVGRDLIRTLVAALGPEHLRRAAVVRDDLAGGGPQRQLRRHPPGAGETRTCLRSGAGLSQVARRTCLKPPDGPVSGRPKNAVKYEDYGERAT